MPIPVPVQPGPAPKLPPQTGRTVPADADRSRRERERDIDEELAQSFPASDPPSWTMGVARAGANATSNGRHDDAPGPAAPGGGASNRIH